MCANTSASKTLPGAETKAPKYSCRAQNRRVVTVLEQETGI